MRHFFYGILTLTLGLAAQPLVAQQQVRYNLSFPNRVHHEAEIQVTFSDVKTDTLHVLMPRSSPGRYALHEFGKNIYSVKVTDNNGRELPVSRPAPNAWNVTGHNGTVTVSYTLFGDHGDGTYAAIDETHAHLNMPATLLYATGFEESPAYVTFNLPEEANWKVATQLKLQQGNTYYAPNFQYLMDSPTEISDFELAEWQIQENGKTKTIQVAMHHHDSEANFNAYVAQVKKIVLAQRTVFGELPDFDFDRYTFIACYVPQAVGDGMEHRNSTMLPSPGTLATSMNRLLGTVAHEFFHTWNVERIRPKTLEPFDYQKANMTESLWLAEGFTSYYTNLSMTRAGITDIKTYADDLAGALNYVLLSPGRQYNSLAEMSRQAPYVDAARSVDAVNRHNTFISYYVYGSVTGLGLDLTLRQQYSKTLDDYMQALWLKYGKTEQPYTLSDLEETLAELTNDKAFAANFFRNTVNGAALPDYALLLAEAGLELRKAQPGTPYLGTTDLKFSKAGAALMAGTLVTSAAYKAGLDRNDVLLTVDGRKIRREKDLKKALARHQPGDSVPITFMRFGKPRSTTLVLDEVPLLEVVLYEATGKQLTPEMQQFRQAWLGAQTK